jgi:chorismate-pyruvate lyase
MCDRLLHEHSAPETVGVILAALLQSSSRPLTRVLEDLSGYKLSIKVEASGERSLTGSERARLNATGDVHCCWRDGALVTDDGTVAARTRLIWVPARLPSDVCRDLDAGDEPAGRVLAPLGMHREDRRAMAAVGDQAAAARPAATRSSAVLVTQQGLRVGIAEEDIDRAFAATLTICGEGGAHATG